MFILTVKTGFIETKGWGKISLFVIIIYFVFFIYWYFYAMLILTVKTSFKEKKVPVTIYWLKQRYVFVTVRFTKCFILLPDAEIIFWSSVLF